jgi:hypothetical protein
MKAPIHQATNTRIFRESRTSEESPVEARPALTSTAMSSIAEPAVLLNLDEPAGGFHSMKIKAALMGKISSVCV